MTLKETTLTHYQTLIVDLNGLTQVNTKIKDHTAEAVYFYGGRWLQGVVMNDFNYSNVWIAGLSCCSESEAVEFETKEEACAWMQQTIIKKIDEVSKDPKNFENLGANVLFTPEKGVKE